MHPKDLEIKDFTYDLLEERVAKFPADERDASKLLVYKNREISEDIYKNLDQHLPENTLLVFNNTKVVEARLIFQKATGALIEVFCLEPHDQYPDITTAMLTKGKVWWKCLIGGASKWKHGLKLEKHIEQDGKQVTLQAAIIDRLSDYFIIELEWTPAELTFAEVLHLSGQIPLPPYVHREVEEKDKETYQTVYAKHDGSVAAPTAGLHFTDRLFNKLSAKGIEKEFVTLHVGAGTFKPVKAEKLEDHEMHAEFMEVSTSTIKNLIKHIKGTVVAVGTTSLRTIESLYWMGVKLEGNAEKTIDEISVHQWEPYDLDAGHISTEKALNNLLSWMQTNSPERIITKTQIMIAPGYDLKVAKAIITNFHQPQSTLLLLISAIVGDNWKKVYQYAMDNDFRFLSYGDGSLLWKQ